MFYGILLIYYDDYTWRAIEKFIQIVEQLAENIEVVVVNNAQPGFWEAERAKCVEIGGDNRVREFTGWDRGIQYIAAHRAIREEDFFVFANDTFCFHREWHASSARRFIRAVAGLQARGGEGMCGEVNGFGKGFQLLGMDADRWISTYLFGATGSYIINSGCRLSLGERELSSLVRGIVDDRILWGEAVDRNLQEHLQAWLFPPPDDSGWHGAKGKDNEAKLQKLRAILNEKYLSAACRKRGGIMMDSGAPRWLRLLGKGRRFLSI